ncbi:hypothetical protein EDD11_008440 [Mortierella claussenii]|nr:hypothetical protein EDD11_008440 [Mortierella claussenii]
MVNNVISEMGLRKATLTKSNYTLYLHGVLEKLMLAHALNNSNNSNSYSNSNSNSNNNNIDNNNNHNHNYNPNHNHNHRHNNNTINNSNNVTLQARRKKEEIQHAMAQLRRNFDHYTFYTTQDIKQEEDPADCEKWGTLMGLRTRQDGTAFFTVLKDAVQMRAY